MFFCIADFFFLRFETSQAPTTNNSENRDRTNKQTDKKKTQKNSTMIDDRRLLKQGQLQRWTEHSTLIFENLKPVEISKLLSTSFEHL